MVQVMNKKLISVIIPAYNEADNFASGKLDEVHEFKGESSWNVVAGIEGFIIDVVEPIVDTLLLIHLRDETFRQTHRSSHPCRGACR